MDFYRAMEFFTFHHGRPLHAWEQACLRSFVHHDHSIALYAYDMLDAPTGVELRAADRIVPRDAAEQFLKDAHGILAHLADFFRYSLLAAEGGCWVDTDVICLSADVPADPVLIGWEDDRYICNAIMRFPKEHPLTAEAAANTSRDRAVKVWGHNGPLLLTRLAQKYGIQARKYLYPFHWKEALALIDPRAAHQVKERLRYASLLHIWHNEFVRPGFHLAFLPPRSSTLGEIMARHLPDAPEMDAAATQRHIDLAVRYSRLSQAAVKR